MKNHLIISIFVLLGILNSTINTKSFFLKYHNIKHPIHVSVTNIEYIDKDKEFNISIRIFVDDFEKIINQKYNANLKFKNTDINNNKYINKYISEHFSINNSKKKLLFIKKEIKVDAIWLYYKYKRKMKIKSIEIKNTLMTDLFHDQTNLLIFSYKNFNTAIKFNNEYYYKKIKLKK